MCKFLSFCNEMRIAQMSASLMRDSDSSEIHDYA